ncbi:hypothetical protein PENNAL_c0011G09404 [Penicillium nalgiovense]|uniref:Uncharacterized protein n=1 Tax=Penicillium nalgiovense TaxID=60175 RepID=A0A1V6YTK5_PENNA|nr:hypothetical protein PENNAL_c0011G09404 [Penicillium nalgiovense]
MEAPRKEYLIQWRGEPREQAQWVKESDAVGAKEKIAEFEDRRLPTARHLMTMNKNSRMELAAYTDKHKLLYYDTIEFDDHGWLVTPPGDHRLSDTLVFLIAGQNIVVARNCYSKWLADFNSDSDIYSDRWPISDPVIMWAYGLPFIPIFANYYALEDEPCQDQAPRWHLGEIVVSAKKLPPPADTTFKVDFGTHNWSKFSPVPTLNCATKRQVLVF